MQLNFPLLRQCGEINKLPNNNTWMETKQHTMPAKHTPLVPPHFLLMLLIYRICLGRRFVTASGIAIRC